MLPSPEYHKPLLNKFFEGNFNFSSICWLKGDNFTFWFRPLFIFTLISNLVCKHPPPLWNDLSCGAAPWKHKPSRALSGSLNWPCLITLTSAANFLFLLITTVFDGGRSSGSGPVKIFESTHRPRRILQSKVCKSSHEVLLIWILIH